MKISEPMLREYTTQLLQVYGENACAPSEPVTSLLESFKRLAKLARDRGDLDALRLGWAFILSNPQWDCRRLGVFPFAASDQDIRQMIQAVLKTLGDGLPEITDKELKTVVLTQTPVEQWWVRK